MKRRIAFLGAKYLGFHCLEHLIKKSEELGCEVACALLNNKAPYSVETTILCQSHEVRILQDLEELLLVKDLELLISVQFNLILKKEHIGSARRAVNLHMAPLPEYRGCNQFSFAIIDDSPIFGTTLHEMDTGIDSGGIIAERRFPIPPNSFVNELLDLTVKESILLFEENAERIVSGQYKAKPQEEFLDRKRGFYKRGDIEKIKLIDLAWPKDKIERHIRATSMPGFEGPYFMVQGKKISLNLKG